MASKDYYQILGVKRNASEDEIKSAYKKAALKWHPDRHANESEEKKKEAEEKFKEIAEAYDVLSDPKKKQMYDTYGTVDGDMSGGFSGGFHSGGFGGFPFGMDPEDIFNHFAGRGGGRSYEVMHEPGATIEIKVSLSIEEIYNGGKKKVEYDIQTRCPKCDGTGGTGLETCPECHGMGVKVETKRTNIGMFTSQTTCPHCHGAGTIIKNKCSECGGTGMKRVSKSVEINIPKGVGNGYQMSVSGAGYESKDPQGKNGDLIITFVYAFDTSRYRVNGSTLYELISVPYYDAILGTEKEVILPNNEKIKIKIPKCSKDGQQIVVSGKGLGYGNYIAIVNVSLPTAITSKEEDALEKIRKIHK